MGGLGIFVSTSAGCVIGFPLAAYVAGWLTTRLKMINVFYSSLVGAITGGIFVLYIPGIIGMSITLGKSISEVTLIALIYLPGDCIKAILCAALTQTLFKLRPTNVLSRV